MQDTLVRPETESSTNLLPAQGPLTGHSEEGNLNNTEGSRTSNETSSELTSTSEVSPINNIASSNEVPVTNEATQEVSVLNGRQVSLPRIFIKDGDFSLAGGRIRWKKDLIKKILRKGAEVQNVTGENLSLFEALNVGQVFLPENLRRNSASLQNFVYMNKVELAEILKNELYRIAKAEGKELPPVSPHPEANNSSTQITDAPATDQSLEELGKQMGRSLDNLIDSLMKGFEAKIRGKAEEIISAIPEQVGPRLEYLMASTVQESMRKVEHVVLSNVRNTEIVRKKVLVVGPISEQANKIEQEMGKVFDMKFISSEDNPRMLKGNLSHAVHIVVMVDKIDHKFTQMLTGHPSVHYVKGGTSSILAKLQDLYANA